MSDQPDDDLYSISEVAERLGLSQEYVRRKVRNGELACVRFGSNAHSVIRIRPSALEAFIASLEQA